MNWGIQSRAVCLKGDAASTSRPRAPNGALGQAQDLPAILANFLNHQNRAIAATAGGFMKCAGIVAAIALAAGLLSCGGSGGGSLSRTTTNPGTGVFSETLMSASNQPLGSFTFNMMQNGTMLTASNMNFANMGSLSQCFASGAVMNGQMGAGMMNGGAMTMTMTSTPASAGTNTLTVQGTMAMGMGSGSGAFTLTGQTPGCTSQTGTFTMTQTSSGKM